MVLYVESWKPYERSCFDTKSSENVNCQLFFRPFETLWELNEIITVLDLVNTAFFHSSEEKIASLLAPCAM